MKKEKPQLVLIVRQKPKVSATKLIDVPESGQATDAWRIEIYGRQEVIIDYV